ncbi:hypothetical protein Bca101_057088 [Brassica carinata]
MLRYLCDSEYGIPKRCPCGGAIIHEVRGKDDYDTLPGKRYFTCKNYEADGFHYRQPWVVGVQEEIEQLTDRVVEAEQVIKGLRNLNYQIETLEVPLSQNFNEYVTLSQNFNGYVPLSQNQPGSSQKPKPLERRKWSPKEDIVLISAWLNTSKDPIVSNEQKAGAFWKRIEEYYNSSPQLSGFATRDSSQCKQRWGRMNAEVGKFVGSYEAALKEQSSGQNENDVMKAAHDIFLNDQGYKFTAEHAWRELRFDQKWKSQAVSRDGAKDKRKEATEKELHSEDVRPPGVKACKAAKRKKHGQEAAYDQLESMLAVKEKISKQRLLERLLARKTETLSDLEVSLKNKLLSEML